jgi:hypothetical protein
MFPFLPTRAVQLIFEYDPTYRLAFKEVLNEIPKEFGRNCYCQDSEAFRMDFFYHVLENKYRGTRYGRYQMEHCAKKFECEMVLVRNDLSLIGGTTFHACLKDLDFAMIHSLNDIMELTGNMFYFSEELFMKKIDTCVKKRVSRMNIVRFPLISVMVSLNSKRSMVDKYWFSVGRRMNYNKRNIGFMITYLDERFTLNVDLVRT